MLNLPLNQQHQSTEGICDDMERDNGYCALHKTGNSGSLKMERDKDELCCIIIVKK